jgi:hypothetical protein
MKKLLLATAALLALPSTANAAVTLTFEGLSNLQEVGSFYGPDYVFSQGSLALVDADAGGSGNTANEPSGETSLVFLRVNSAILNVTNGFTTGFSFFYSANSTGFVSVYDDFNAGGNLLGQIAIVNQYNQNCAGDPSGSYCNWTASGLAFGGLAKSIDFGGTANFVVYDNITFGSVNPGGGVPEPAAWAMMLAGFGLVGGAMRRRQANVSFA